MSPVDAAGDVAGTDAPPDTLIRKTKWGVVWLLTLTLFSALTVGGLLAPIQEAAKLELGLSDMQLALIVGTATAIPVAVLALPIAWYVDHGVRVRLLTILAALWAVGTVGTAFVQDFYGLFVARFVAGVGAGTAFSVLISILADVCLPQKRGRVMVLVSMGAWAGAAAAYFVGAGLFGYFEAHPLSIFPGMAAWRASHLVVGVAAAVLVLPLFLLREPKRYEIEQTSVAIGPTLRAFWNRKSFLGPLLIGNFAGGLAEGAAALWIGSVLVRQYGQTPAQTGWVGLVILVSGIVGSLIGGFSADAGQKLKVRGGILVPAVIATALSIPASAYPMMPTLPGFALVLFVLLVGGTIVNLVNSAAIAVLIPNEERALSLAGLKLVATIVGGPITAAIIVAMTARMEGPGSLGVILTWLGVITGVISLIGYWFAMVNAPRPVGETLPDTPGETAGAE